MTEERAVDTMSTLQQGYAAVLFFKDTSSMS